MWPGTILFGPGTEERWAEILGSVGPKDMGPSQLLMVPRDSTPPSKGWPPRLPPLQNYDATPYHFGSRPKVGLSKNGSKNPRTRPPLFLAEKGQVSRLGLMSGVGSGEPEDLLCIYPLKTGDPGTMGCISPVLA